MEVQALRWKIEILWWVFSFCFFSFIIFMFAKWCVKEIQTMTFNFNLLYKHFCVKLSGNSKEQALAPALMT